MELTKPLEYYTKHDEEPLLFHLIDVGEGLMFLIIFPDETTLLFDCNVSNQSEDNIIEYLEKSIPPRYDPESMGYLKWIDIFVNSHRDDDHLRGLSKINKKFPIKAILDSGETGASTSSDDYKYYMGLRRRLIKKYGDDAVIIPQPSKKSLKSFGGAEVYCLNSSLEYSDQRNYITQAFYEYLIENEVIRAAKTQHTNSIVLSVRYAGRAILLTGDSDWLAWRDKIMPIFKYTELLKSNILIASHHGSRSFFTDESQNDTIDPENNPDSTYIEHISKISPSITLIPCGEYKTAHHPNKEAKKIYEENTSGEQVYTTHEKWTLAGFINNSGEWTVVPSRFFPASGHNNFTLNCVCSNSWTSSIKNSGDYFNIGSELLFTIRSKIGILDPINEVNVFWEVSNGGINEDSDHQEIYYKGKNEDTPKHQFARHVSYRGKHLLRCKVHNKRKNIIATKVFIVNG